MIPVTVVRRFPLKFLAVSIVLAMAASASAQAPAQPKKPEPGTIEGTVVRAATNEPLRRARVTLRRAEGRSELQVAATTDAAGKFILRGVEPGRYRLVVERIGFVRQEFGQRNPGRPGSILTLSEGQTLRDLTFRMIPWATITGRVFDEDGEPLPWVQVQVLRSVYARGRREFVPAGGFNTNDLGEYRIFGLAPGRYVLSATVSGFMRGTPATRGAENQQDEAYTPTYYPGTTDPDAAELVELRAGEELRQFDFRFIPVRAVRVRGRVTSAVDVPSGRNIQVSLLPRGPGRRGFRGDNSTGANGPEGDFELRGVVPGAYYLMALLFHEGKNYSARTQVDVGGADLEGMNLTIGPGVELTGVLQVEGFKLGEREVSVGLSPREEFAMFGGGGGSGRVNADGSFLIPNAPEGTFDVFVARLDENSYLKSARLGAQDVLESGITIYRGKMAGRLEVVVSGAGARVEGVVLNEDNLPVSGATVVAVPDPRRRARALWYKVATTDQFGRFALKGLAPGDYKLFAWEEIEQGIYQDPDFIRPLERRGFEIRLGEGESRTAELKVIPSNGPTN
jgi:hypothetical protein